MRGIQPLFGVHYSAAEFAPPGTGALGILPGGLASHRAPLVLRKHLSRSLNKTLKVKQENETYRVSEIT